MQKPVIENWCFVRMTTGLPAEKKIVESILTTIQEKGVIDATEMRIGISGDGRTGNYDDGFDIRVSGLRSQIIRISMLSSGNLSVVTANYNEYIVDAGSMLSEKAARLEQQRQESEERQRTRANKPGKRLERGSAPAISWAV